MVMRYLSLFSGIECAHLAWRELGWQCAAVSEIEPNACAVLRARLPDIPNLGSVTEITDERIAALGRIDVVVGGSPCQDLSVAGKRAGLAGARSGLFHEQLRIFHAARKHCGARWLVWENVPGAFSSHGGRDFAVVVGEMAGCSLAVPADGWGSEGMALGENGLVEWCVLDAQWFGVAQRRRRVFAVLDTGDWIRRPPVLLEPESLRGDFAPRREKWEEIAPTLSARIQGGGGLGTGFDCDGGLIPDVCGALTDGTHNGGGSTGRTRTRAESLPAVSMCLNAGAMGRRDAESETLIPIIGGDFDVAHSLRADGFDASEDGTGRGTPLAPIAFQTRGSNLHIGDVAGTIGCNAGSACGCAPCIAFDCKASGRNGFGVGEVAPTLRAMGHSANHANAGGQIAIAFAENSRAEVRMENGDGPGTLSMGGGKPGQGAPCVVVGEPYTLAIRGRGDSHDLEYRQDGTANALLTPNGGRGGIGVGAIAQPAQMAVRRLTPRECERLQGVEDDWTLVPNAKGKPMADGPRYKMLGNGFARPCVAWIGRQIDRANMGAVLPQAVAA